MTRYCRYSTLTMALVCAAGLLMGSGFAAPAATPAGSCAAVSSIKTRTPVLFVHGFTDDSTTWAKAVDLFCTETTFTQTFDYGRVDDGTGKTVDYSADWVTDPHIGHDLARTITTLADASKAAGGPGKVLLVGHSLGGLAIRCAADSRCNGGVGSAPAGQASTVAQDIAAITTFGTPNLGSFLKGNGDSIVFNVLGILSSGLCTAAQNDTVGADIQLNDFCKEVRALGTSAAGRAFTPGSSELAHLPNQPAGVPVLAVAGAIKVEVNLFNVKVPVNYTTGATDNGDLVVGDDSAVAQSRGIGAQGGSVTIDCGTVVLGGRPVWDSTHLKCWHGSEPSNDAFLQQVKRMIDAYKPPGILSSSVVPSDPTACGSVTSAIGTPVRVSIVRGTAVCSTAENIVQMYYQRVSTEGQGSGGSLNVKGWNCISTTIGIQEQTGALGNCYLKQTDTISMDLGFPVVTDSAFGPVRLGMTPAQVAAATPAAPHTNAHCTTFDYSVSGSSGKATAIVHDAEGVVIAIETPAGTKTDRGVGDGSTVEQVRAAYAKDRNVASQSTQAGLALLVTTGNPDDAGRGNPGHLIGFAMANDGTVGPPQVGGVPGYEHCSG